MRLTGSGAKKREFSLGNLDVNTHLLEKGKLYLKEENAVQLFFP